MSIKRLKRSRRSKKICICSGTKKCQCKSNCSCNCSKRCFGSKIKVRSFRRSSGTLVKEHFMKHRGPVRSRGARSGIFSARRGYIPWIKRYHAGKLGGTGFLSKSETEQHRILQKCMKKYGYKSCLGSLLVLNRNQAIREKHSAQINKLVKYLESNHR